MAASMKGVLLALCLASAATAAPYFYAHEDLGSQDKYLVIKNNDDTPYTLSQLGIIRANNGGDPQEDPNAVTRLGTEDEEIVANGGLLFVTHPNADLAPYADTYGEDEDVMRVNGNDFLGLFTLDPDSEITTDGFYNNGTLIDVIGEAGVNRGWTIDPPSKDDDGNSLNTQRPEPISDDTNAFDRSVLLRWDEDAAPETNWTIARKQWHFKNRKEYDIFVDLLGFSPVAKQLSTPALIRAYINGENENKGVMIEHTGEEPAIRQEELIIHVFDGSSNKTTSTFNLAGNDAKHGNLCPKHYVLAADSQAEFASNADVQLDGLSAAINNGDNGANPIALEHFVPSEAEAVTVDVIGTPNSGSSSPLAKGRTLVRNAGISRSNAGDYNPDVWTDEKYDGVPTNYATVESKGFNDICSADSNIFFKMYAYHGSPEQYWMIENSGPKDVPLSNIEFAISNNGYIGFQTPPFQLSEEYNGAADGNLYVLPKNKRLLACDPKARYAHLCHIPSSRADTFNGNDHLALFVDGIEVDVIGEHREDRYFSVDNDKNLTLENSTILRKDDVQQGNNNWLAQAGQTSDDESEWTVLPALPEEEMVASLLDFDFLSTRVGAGAGVPDQVSKIGNTLGSMDDEPDADGETVTSLIKYLVQQAKANSGSSSAQGSSVKQTIKKLATETKNNNGVPPFMQQVDASEDTSEPPPSPADPPPEPGSKEDGPSPNDESAAMQTHAFVITSLALLLLVAQ